MIWVAGPKMCKCWSGVKHKTLVWHLLYNVGPTSKMLGRRYINVIQMFCVFRVGKHLTGNSVTAGNELSTPEQMWTLRLNLWWQIALLLQYGFDEACPSRMLKPCRFDVGPALQTLAQHQNDMGFTSRVYQHICSAARRMMGSVFVDDLWAVWCWPRTMGCCSPMEFDLTLNWD